MQCRRCQPVLDTVAESAARLCESFDANIFRRDGDRLVLVAHHGPIPVGPIGEFTIPLGRGTAAGRAVLDGRAVHVADMQTEPDEFPESIENARQMGHRTILSVPLIREGVAVGVVALCRTEAQLFTDRQIVLLQTFADQAAIAIENVRLFEELEARNPDLPQSLEQQTATSGILRDITSSPTNHRPRRRRRWNWLAYIPLVPYLVWLIIRHRSPTVFTAANPGIATGGTVGESKAAILTSVERAGGPVAEFSLVAPNSDRGSRVRAATRWMDETGVPFPVIVKPDVGEQGWGVALICTRRGLERYFDCMQGAIIVQRYFPGIEAGIFYCRRPGTEHGRIVSISERIHRRGVRVDPCPEEAPSIVFGFTCHDVDYRDALNWRSPRLERVLDALGRAVPGFFFGRFDVRAASVDALRRGEFTVIELNGVLSESTQIYDPAVSFARACATLFHQWRGAFEIGAENRARGTVPTRLRELAKLMAMKTWRRVSARRLRNLARMSRGRLPTSAEPRR